MQTESVAKVFNSITGKALGVAALTVLMLWPLARVEHLVSERQSLQRGAFDVIAAGFGGAQVVGAPIISVPIEERSTAVDPLTKLGTEVWTRGTLHLVPDEVTIGSDVAVEVRSKGIYSLPVYVTKVVVTGRFEGDTLARLLASDAATRVLPGPATVQLPVSGIQYLRSVGRFDLDGRSLRVTSGEVAGLNALTAAIDLPSPPASHALSFRIEFECAGSASLHFLPLASTTRVAARVGWPNPDFDGAFLPVSHVNRAADFSANWQVMALNRSIPESWRNDSLGTAVLQASAFGVRLFQPSDVYTQNYRAVRYGILFIAITFVCFFAWDHLLRGVRLHPLQYLLVGVALATFYLLLLAMSEHVGFAMSYALAATALVALITTYLGGSTDNRTEVAMIGTALGIAYGVLYFILLSEDYALLFGSLLIFGILAGLMLATRRLDWRRLGRDEEEQIG